MKTIIILLIISFIILINSCEESPHIKDGYILNGTVTDSLTGIHLSSVKIYDNILSFDSTLVENYAVYSDSLGKFIFYGGPATTSTDEVLRFERQGYFTKYIRFANWVSGDNSNYILTVSLRKR